MVFVGLSIQEVEVPLPSLLGVSIDVRIVPLTSLQVHAVHYTRKPLPLLRFWCKGSHNGTATTGISVSSVKVVKRGLILQTQCMTGFLFHVRITGHLVADNPRDRSSLYLG